MPHYEFSKEALEWMKEIGEEPIPSAEQTYESASEQFDASSLDEPARTVHQRLVAAGATEIRCTYDGGGDEGFAHFEHAVIGGVAVGIGELGERMPTSIRADDSGAQAGSGAVARVESFREALDLFAHELASRLLGEGYGTGEYTMYGAFVADLTSGRITDLEEA